MNIRAHCLKTWSSQFDLVELRRKTHEFRKNDRDFKIGDLVVLLEWLPNLGEFTGRTISMTILHITTGFGIPDGYCILQLYPDSIRFRDAPPEVAAEMHRSKNGKGYL